MVHHRAAARMPVRSSMACKVVGRLVAEVFHGVASLDQCHALGRWRSSSTERISEPSWSRWPRLCACSLSSSSRSMRVGAMEEIDGRPQEILEVGFEAGFAQARDERVEDVGDGGSDDAGLGSGSSWKGR